MWISNVCITVKLFTQQKKKKWAFFEAYLENSHFCMDLDKTAYIAVD